MEEEEEEEKGSGIITKLLSAGFTVLKWLPTDQPTDRWTDRPTNTASYRDAWTHQKNMVSLIWRGQGNYTKIRRSL